MTSEGGTICFSPESRSLLPGLRIFEDAFPERIAAGGRRVVFRACRPARGFSLSLQEEEYLVEFGRPCDAFRALGLLLGEALPTQNISEDPAFESVGVMWDLSRNAVLKPEAVETLFQKFALTGVNVVQLYMEDVYLIPGEPFFGYARGAYSHEELRRIDEYGHLLGIEVVACIQTLGHLEQILQWPAYADCVDASNVLLAGDEKSRELIGKMLDVVGQCFRSRTVHVGMDEAFGVGTGKYLVKHGFERPFDILNRHLQMVAEMCRDRGLEPMIWSDMYFRIGSATRDYYDRDCVIPPEVAAEIPANVELVYWDYYSADTAFYEEWIRRHRDLGKEPVYAASAWSHGRFWAYEPRWRESISAGMRAARNQGLRSVLLTVWFDDGAECHPASVLPALQYFTEWAYAGEPKGTALESRFRILASGALLPDYLRASQLDEIPAIRGAAESEANYSKWILWHDPVLGFLDAQLSPDMPEHYSRLAETLDRFEADEAIRFAAQLARALASKTELHLKARSAWRSSDSGELRRLKEEVLPEALHAMRHLWRMHREMWKLWHKPFGWEVLERRYAGTTARLESLGNILEDCLQTPGVSVPEWNFDRLSFDGRQEKCFFRADRAFTPSALK